MKFEARTIEVEQNGVLSTGAFTIRATNKAFRILADGLYGNKIMAMERELTCNSLDAHLLSGKSDVPIDVHLPTAIEPYFSVRDYGMGMSHDFMMTRYTCVFDSTKTDSNLETGGFGLGRVSAISYANSYMVTTCYEKFKRVYTVFINEQDLPAISLLSEESTKDGNGVEVSCAVKSSDFYSFKQNALEFFRRVKSPVIFNGGATDFSPLPIKLIPDIGNDVWAIRNDTDRAVVVMGSIAYPLRDVAEMNLTSNEKELLDCSLEINLPIGSIDVAASREALQMTPKSCAFIKDLLGKMLIQIKDQMNDTISAAPNFWQACVSYKNLKSGGLRSLNNALDRLVSQWNGKDVRKGYVGLDNDKNLWRVVRYSWFNCRSKLSTSAQYSMPIDDKLRLFIVDDEKSLVRRVRHDFQTNIANNGSDIYCVFPNGAAEADIIAHLGREGEDFLKFSEYFPKPPPAQRSSTSDKGKSLMLEYKGHSSCKASDGWKLIPNFDINDGGVYLHIANYIPEKCGSKSDADTWWHYVHRLADELGVTIPAVIGVKSRALKQFEKAKHWQTLETWIKQAFQRKLQNAAWVKGRLEYEASRNLTSDVRNQGLFTWASDCVINGISFPALIKQLHGDYKNASKSAGTDLKEIARWAQYLGVVVTVPEVEEVFQKRIDDVLEKAPLLGTLGFMDRGKVTEFAKSFAEYADSRKY